MTLRFTQISAGGFHSLGLTEDGTVRGWGKNDEGQINIPKFGGKRVIQINAGKNYSLALLEDGSVRGWGSIGIDLILDFGGKVIQISCKSNNIFALLDNKKVVKRFGSNKEINFENKQEITQISAEGSNILALFAKGGVEQLIRYNNEYIKNKISDDLTYGGVTEIAITQIASGESFSLALKKNGTVVGWGGNRAGHINIPTFNGLKVIQISAGGVNSLALLEDGTVRGWGPSSSSIPNFGGMKVIQISSGYTHSLALLENGNVIGWGNNNFGQIYPPYDETISDYEIQEPTLANYEALKHKVECTKCRIHIKKIILDCNHAFCEMCISSLVNCPICSKLVTSKPVLYQKYYKY
jgi:alpha-tubulin suppressor-like RCC1 family protein